MVSATSLTLPTHALKEWQVAVHALEQGETIMLLRKGGIREVGGTFTIPYDRVWLYPTYEHQRSHLVKRQYVDAITPVEPGWYPETVCLGSWALITDCFHISNAATVAALLPFHVWNEAFVEERLKWKPNHPLDVLLLRVYRLPLPQTLPYEAAYGGCKSWIELPTIAQRGSFTQAWANSVPALKDADYNEQKDAIRAILS